MLGKVTTRIPKAKERIYKSMASTVLRSSEATFEIEFSPPPKPAAAPLRENLDVHPIVSGGRKKRSVHTVPSHSVSVRSGGGSTVVTDKLAMHERLNCASQGQFSEEARLIRSTSAFSNRSARVSAPGRVMRSKPLDGNNSRGGSSHLLAQSNNLSASQRPHRVNLPGPIAHPSRLPWILHHHPTHHISHQHWIILHHIHHYYLI